MDMTLTIKLIPTKKTKLYLFPLLHPLLHQNIPLQK